jgi:hypothetical protein
MTPLYNHVLMALPTTGDDLKTLHKEILSFLWSKTVNEETIKNEATRGKEMAVSKLWHGWPSNSTPRRNS